MIGLVYVTLEEELADAVADPEEVADADEVADRVEGTGDPPKEKLEELEALELALAELLARVVIAEKFYRFSSVVLLKQK